MANYTIPCDTFVRLATIAQKPRFQGSRWLKTVRIENGVAIASNRALIVVERLETGSPGIIHIPADPTLIEKCRAEIPYHSNLFIAAVETVGMASAKTTLGYNHPGNAIFTSTDPNELDEWRSKVPTKYPAQPKGAMCWDTEQIALLAASAPSGSVIFPDIVDATQPIIVRDPVDPRWFAMFQSDTPHSMKQPAVVPEWFK